MQSRAAAKSLLADRQDGAYFWRMSYRTVEVEIDHGRVSAKGAEKLPEKASGLLTIFRSDSIAETGLSPLQALESLQQHLRLDATKAAEWMTAVREARR